MSPAIRDGQNGLVVDTNEPRFSMGSGPVERRQVSPERMADIAAERVVLERAAAAQAAPAAARPGPSSHWVRKRAERLPSIAAALLETTSYAAAAERLGMTRDALTQLIYQYRRDGALPADVDELIRARATKQAAPQRSPAPVATIEVQAPEAGAPATDADELGPTATGPAAEQVATPPEPTSTRARLSVAAAEALAFDHEHGRLYDALKVAEERAELAGDDGIRVELRAMRRRVARHLEDRTCDDLPDDVRHARGIEDDYAEAARQAAYGTAGR